MDFKPLKRRGTFADRISRWPAKGSVKLSNGFPDIGDQLMPFYLYQIKCNTCIQQRREPLLRVLKEFANKNVRSGISQWHAREDDLLLGMGANEDEKHAVIIDLKPDTP